MRKAAGILFLADDGTALFLKRGNGGDHPNEWCFPGGTQEEGESALQCAEREAVEELGFLPDGTRTELTRRIKADPVLSQPLTPASVVTSAGEATPVLPGDTTGGQVVAAIEEVDFTTYLQRVSDKFTPKTNGEHTGWAWASVESPPEPLHPGCRIALARLTMDELGVARAIANGELVSPQRYQNLYLFAMRITGTGFSYRPKLNEFVFRRPENYLTPEFLERCNGLPVVMLHPDKKSTLDSDEFGKRVVGTMCCPFINGDEVWGIARIYDDATIKLLSTKQMSTSPGVVLARGYRKLSLEDGAKLLIEDKVSLLDHLAICEQGVWDKGGEASGIVSITAEDADMAEKEDKETGEKKADSERKDASGGTPLDMVLEGLGKINGRLDAMEESRRKDSERLDAVCGRMDSMESERKDTRKDTEDKDAEDKDAEEAERKDKARKDAEEAERKDKARKDAEEAERKDKARKDEEKEAERADSTALNARFAAIESRLPLPLTDEDTAKFAEAQARADDVYHAFGGAAPRPLSGETLTAYRRRLLSKIQPHSSTWKEVDLLKVTDSAFDVAEKQIYTDAMNAALSPVGVPEDQLRPIVRRDSTGRQITTFVGRPRAWMRDFSLPAQYLTGINKSATIQ